MSVAAILSGAALCVAAYAFHWRARLLGDQARGWPAAPLVIRVAIDTAALALLLAGLWQVTGRALPPWLQAAVSLALAVYAVIFALNIGRQRGASPKP
jgi:hypothetical protein